MQTQGTALLGKVFHGHADWAAAGEVRRAGILDTGVGRGRVSKTVPWRARGAAERCGPAQVFRPSARVRLGARPIKHRGHRTGNGDALSRGANIAPHRYITDTSPPSASWAITRNPAAERIMSSDRVATTVMAALVKRVGRTVSAWIQS